VSVGGGGGWRNGICDMKMMMRAGWLWLNVL
jgi:hypothetical protein